MPVIRINASGGQAVYEGPGELEVGPVVRHRCTRFSILQQAIRPDGTRVARRTDLSGLLREVTVDYQVAYRLPAPPDVPGATDLMGTASEYTLNIELPAEDLAFLPRLLDEPLVRPEERGSPDARVLLEALERVHVNASEVARRFREHSALASRSHWSGRLAPVPEYDELIESTRDAFPHDPYRYGRVHPDGPHRWTPPKDPSEKVARCP